MTKPIEGEVYRDESGKDWTITRVVTFLNYYHLELIDENDVVGKAHVPNPPIHHL